MAFPSNTGSTPISLSLALQNAQQIAGQVKAQAQSLVTLATGAGVPAFQLLTLPATWTNWNNQLTSYANLSGMAAFAQAQLGDASIGSDFAAMQAAITAVVNWITANFPASNGFLQALTFGSGGVVNYVTFTPAQLTPLVILLNALIATIN